MVTNVNFDNFGFLSPNIAMFFFLPTRFPEETLDSAASPGVLGLFNDRVEAVDAEFDAVFELYDGIACKSQCTISIVVCSATR